MRFLPFFAQRRDVCDVCSPYKVDNPQLCSRYADQPVNKGLSIAKVKNDEGGKGKWNNMDFMNTPWIGEETDKENLPFNVRSCQSNSLDNHVALLIASACILAAADNEPFDIQGYN